MRLTDDVGAMRAGCVIFLILWILQIIFHYETGREFSRVCTALEARLDDSVIKNLLGEQIASLCFSRTRD
jgi:hypothetical protein